jgi:histidine ammonia-lyase
MQVVIEDRLTWRSVVEVAKGADLALSDAAATRIERGRAIVDSLVVRGIRAYGVNIGVGALCDTVVDRPAQRRLSRNLVMSHACGVGEPLAPALVRSIIAAQVANYAHGLSGVRLDLVAAMLGLLSGGIAPVVPSRGSVGYLTHMAHVALVLIGEGTAVVEGRTVSGAEALAMAGLQPLVLEAKEGLSLVNGPACGVGLAAMALSRAEGLLEWSDAVAALTLEALGAQMPAFAEETLRLRVSPGIAASGAAIRRRLDGSGQIETARGIRTQDALSLRAVPQVHGAARDLFEWIIAVVDRELASVTDNPAVWGTPDAPIVASEAHAVAPALGQGMDALGVALAQVAAMSERRMDRMVNPQVSAGLPPFLAHDPGAGSGFMIAQYTAAALVADNRRLASPASLDGGVTSALQEDFLAHPTGAALKLHQILDNVETVLAIELLSAVEAADFRAEQAPRATRAAGTDLIHHQVRGIVDRYADDRPLGSDIARAARLVRERRPG